MDEIPQTSVEEFGHLGLVAAIIRKFDIAKRIDQLVPKTSNNQKINHADAILAMIYQGLGFGDGRLYFAQDFFSNKPLEKLFGKSISADLFNDDVLGAALDAVSAFGSTRFFANMWLSAVKTRKKLKCIIPSAILSFLDEKIRNLKLLWQIFFFY